MEDYKKYTLASTPDECKTQIQVYMNLGVTYFMLYFADLPDVDSLRLFSSGCNRETLVRGHLVRYVPARER